MSDTLVEQIAKALAPDDAARSAWWADPSQPHASRRQMERLAEAVLPFIEEARNEGHDAEMVALIDEERAG